MKNIQGSKDVRTTSEEATDRRFTHHEKVLFLTSAQHIYFTCKAYCGKPFSFDEKFELNTCPREGYTRSLAAFQDEISGPETGPLGKKIPLPAKKQLLLQLRNELLTSIPFKTSSHQGTAGSWVLTFHRHQLQRF